jgi:hypothetical protein
MQSLSSNRIAKLLFGSGMWETKAVFEENKTNPAATNP